MTMVEDRSAAVVPMSTGVKYVETSYPDGTKSYALPSAPPPPPVTKGKLVLGAYSGYNGQAANLALN